MAKQPLACDGEDKAYTCNGRQKKMLSRKISGNLKTAGLNNPRKMLDSESIGAVFDFTEE